MKQCKHCNKVKSKHEPVTLHCPIKSKGFSAVYGTDNVYDEYETDPVHFEITKIKVQNAIKEFDVEFDNNENTFMSEQQKQNYRAQAHSQIHHHFNNWLLPELTKNAVLKVEINGVSTEYDAEWIGNIVHEEEKALADMYFSADWDDSIVPVMTVTSIETGQVSIVTYNPESADLISTEELRNKSTLEDFSTMNSTEEVSLSDLNIEDFIIPLHDKQWVLNEIRETSDADCDDEVQDLERVLTYSDGSIVLGKPDTANDGTYLMFGIKDKDGLLEDGYCVLDNILYKHWSKLDSDFIEIGTFESHINIDESEHKGITKFMSEVIGRSLFSTESIDMKSTADCKAFMKSEYNVQKAKRTKKEKWGKIEYRIFEDDNGEQYTIVTYNDKLISHYAFAYNEYY